MFLSIAGTVLSAVGGLQQASAAKAIASENAQIQAANARLESASMGTQADILREQTMANYRLRSQEAGQAKANAGAKSARAVITQTINAANSKKAREAGERLVAQQKGRYAAAGVVESTGSPLSNLVYTAGILERDRGEQNYYNSLVENELFQEAALERLGGEYALAGATMDKSAGLAEVKLRTAAANAALASGLRKSELTKMAGKAESTGLMLGTAGSLLNNTGSLIKTYGKN